MNSYLLGAYCFTFTILAFVLIMTIIDFKTGEPQKKK